MIPVGFDIGLEATERNARSALPQAPVQRTGPESPHRTGSDPRKVTWAAKVTGNGGAAASADRSTLRHRAPVRLRFMAAGALRTVAARAVSAAERIEPRRYEVAPGDC
jgi:hypothetical protein